ncbi:uncharacterized protein BDZ99DRAFT_569614 [Mytilinidion resinicola]|uniref:Rhodopsin domain-containing protein n=1 Tax=Mytilinidion resinicola TaxID=574789 RepID=A0A6A6YST0_9PEZI|nr:uncharacterized protein BDZ99DRAFT_569614 [Mytilinidion resinicola]KAF2811618.1 hypothetical protein BDZ99DRAFT_569614 [Mytilinidion resinicola]
METPGAASTDHHTKVAFILGFLITLTTLMLTFFVLRIYARLSIIGYFGIEDWLVAGAVLGILVETVDGCVSTKYGAGYHIQDFKPEWAVPYARTSFISGAVFPICVAFPKLSLCITYLRIFPSKGNRNFCYTAIVYLICWLISITLVTLFACSVCITAVIRLIYLEKVFTAPDFAYNGAIIWVTTSVELNIGIICSCLHTVKPLLKKWFPRTFGSSNDRHISDYPNTKPRSYGIISDRSFPFKSLGGDGGKDMGLERPEAVAKNPFHSRTRSSSSTVTNVPMVPLKEEYKGIGGARVEAWAEGGEGRGAVPLHGITYTQSVTVDSRSVGGPGDVDIEQAIGRSGDEEAVGLRKEINDTDSEEWIMNDQGRRD